LKVWHGDCSWSILHLSIQRLWQVMTFSLPL
jgi:hypothetical protein